MASPTTRERLLETAERLFAERGIPGVSLREIGVAAGQRNNSAAQYHFGSKQALVDAIFEHRMRPINRQRLAMLDEIDCAGRAGELAALFEAMVRPLADAIARGSFYARFLAQVISGPAQGRLTSLALEVMEGGRRVADGLESCLRELPPAIRAHRLMLAARLTLHALAEYERELDAGGSPVVPRGALVSDLVEVLVSMAAAPVSAATRGELRPAEARRA